jgi:hypothetical protein
VAPVITPFAGALSQIILASAQMKMRDQQLKMEEEHVKKMNSVPTPTPAQQQIVAGKPAAQTETGPPNEASVLMEFVNVIVNPALTQYLKSDYAGDALAEALYEMYPTYKGVDWLKMMKTAGPDQVVQLYKTSPLWPQLELMEASFTEFVTEFCGYTPEEQPAQEKPAASGAAGPVDLDMES